MTIQEANNNIGKPFKMIGFTGGLMSEFDTIIRVDADGTIHGNYIEAHCDDCRLKQAQPEQLRRRLTDESLLLETASNGRINQKRLQ